MQWKTKKSNPQLFMIYLKLIIWGITQNVKYYFFQSKKKYSFRPILFVLFEKSNILKEHYLLSCLPYKNV